MTYANIQASISLDCVKVLKLACEGARVQREIVELLSQDEVFKVVVTTNSDLPFSMPIFQLIYQNTHYNNHLCCFTDWRKRTTSWFC